MRSIEFRRLFLSSLLAMGLVTLGASPSLAQSTGDADNMQTMPDDRDDDGTDWGWIGLLGLAGLLGLRRRDHDHVDRVDRVDTTRARP